VELRPGYRQTEVGVIPEEWNDALLDLIAKRGSGHTPDKKHPEYWNGNIKWISLADSIALDRVYIDDSYAKITFAGIANSSAVIHPAGTVVLSRDAGVGKSAIMRTEMAVSQHFMAWHCGPELDNHFLYYWLQSAKPEFERIANGSTIKTIGLPYFKDLKIPQPPLLEQRAIAGALSDVDALLDGLDRLIGKKRDLKRAAMQELFIGQTRLPEFHGEWEVVSFTDVFRKINAKEYQVQTSEYQTTGNFPIVDQGKEAVVGFSDSEDKRFQCPRGGVIIFGDHTCIVKFVDFDFVVGADGTQILATKAGHCACFHALQLQFRGVPTTGYNRHFKFLKERAFLSPPLPEQTAIAEVLTDMEAELAVLEQRREKTCALKQAMMQELLTGRTRLI